jgi:hypothetical protein
MGHIGLGIVLTIAFGLVFQLLPVSNASRLIWPFAIAVGVCTYWEVSAFRSFAARSTGLFPPDTALLWRNAVAASLYMVLGIALGMAWQCALLFSDSDKAFLLPPRFWTWLGVAVTVFCTVTALAVAYPWVRQKMMWQKAAMPFLFRLADARDTIAKDDAQRLQAYADQHLRKRADRTVHTPVLLISGPLWAGKTSFACGIGTEAAFRNMTVRYVTFNKLKQMAESARDDLGPSNIVYWKWKQSEVVVVDDIDSGTFSQDFTALESFKAIAVGNHFADHFSGRISIWVIGPKAEDELAAWQNAISEVCTGTAPDGTAVKPEMMTIRLYLPGTDTPAPDASVS